MRPAIALLVLLGCACGPGSPGTTESESSGTSEPTTGPGPTSGETTGGATGEATATADPTTGEALPPDACGPPPMAPVCENGISDPHVALCAPFDEADCEKGLGPQEEGIECRWVNTEILVADAVGCGAAKASGTCIAVAEVGDGCTVESTCAGVAEDITQYRFTQDCEIEVFKGSFCGYSVLGWKSCTWDEAPDAECRLPWPSEGPATCNCAC